MQSGGQGYLSMVAESAAVSPEDVVSLEPLETTAAVPNWRVSECCSHHRRMLDTRRFLGMFLNGRSRTMVHRCGMQHGTDIGRWMRRLSEMRP